MGPILQFMRPHDVFDTATLILLGEAYDMAVASLHNAGQSAIVREAIADRIFDLAASGERDVERLREEALVALGSRL
jgi:hypothetical protein